MSPSTERTVLVVDDDESVRIGLAMNIETQGYITLEATDGLDALEILRTNADVELVLADVKMRDMSGVDLLERVRKIRPRLPFIIMTGYTASDEITRALRLGAFTVLTKPFNPLALFKIVQRAIKAPSVLLITSRSTQNEFAARLATFFIRARTSAVAVAEEVFVHEEVDVIVVNMVEAVSEEFSEIARLHPKVSVIVLAEPKADLSAAGATIGRPFISLREPVQVEQLAGAIAKARAGSASDAG